MLFLPPVDADNTNAQSLNVREIAQRLDPECIESTLWYEPEPDARLPHRPGIHLLQLPRQGKTPRILKEQLSGYDIIAYMDYSPASYLLVHVPRWFRGRAETVFHAGGAGGFGGESFGMAQASRRGSTQTVTCTPELRNLSPGTWPGSYTAE